MNLSRRIEDSRISEGVYRGLKDRLSYSSIKLFDQDRQSFYRQMILGEKSREKTSVAKTMGSLVHLYLAEQQFDTKFHLMSALQPVGQMLDLVNNLYDRAMRSVETNDKGQKVIGEKFEVLFADAVQWTKYDSNLQEVKFKGKDMQKILSMFYDSDAEIYYKEMLSCIGKEVVSESMDKKAEDICNTLKNHSYTSEYANARTGGNISVFNELAILFEHEGVPYKSLLDKMIINHLLKTIQPLDWKTAWDNEEPAGAYLKFGYYLQAAMYNLAIVTWMNEHPELEGYTVLPMIYVFCDTAAWSDPIVLKLKTEDIQAGWLGFKIKGSRYVYRGLKELMDDLAWHVDTSKWSTSKAISEKNGELLLSLEYEIAG